MNNRNIARGAALALAAVMSLGVAQASTIEGILNFTGEAAPVPGPGLSDAIGLSFTSGFFVTNATGTFAANGLNFADVGTIADFLINPFTPVDPLITILFDPGPGKFTFSLESLVIENQSADFLVLSGTGTLVGTGLDPTPYNLSLSVDNSGGSLFGFSGTLAPVPVPGALVLFLSGLAALGIRRRD